MNLLKLEAIYPHVISQVDRIPIRVNSLKLTQAYEAKIRTSMNSLKLEAMYPQVRSQVDRIPISYSRTKDYFITGRADTIFCAVGLR